MANVIDTSAISSVIKAEYERGLTRGYDIIPFANRDFEWDIADKWDTVKVPYIQVADWNDTGTPDADITAGDFTIGTHALTITQYNDVRLKISEKDISKLGTDMGTIAEIVRQLQIKAATKQEDYLVTKILAGSSQANQTWTSDVNNIFDQVVDLRTALTTKNAPKEGRKLFVASDILGLMVKAKILNDFPAWYKVQSEAEVGRVAGFTVVESNAIPAWTMVAYVDKAANFVQKLAFLKVTEAPAGNYYNIVWALFYDADVLWVGKDQIVIHTQS